jgi:hypothetical protein
LGIAEYCQATNQPTNNNMTTMMAIIQRTARLP